MSENCRYYSFGHYCDIDIDKSDPDYETECAKCHANMEMDKAGVCKFDIWGDF